MLNTTVMVWSPSRATTGAAVPSVMTARATTFRAAFAICLPSSLQEAGTGGENRQAGEPGVESRYRDETR
jgi:hypothetical protein